ncbi:MAG: CxxC-x17-CxxC domain-containing protein, partial [Patescibacteria group bacterium]
SDLMGIFTKIWANVWSSRMEYILSNCVLALLDTPGTTLLGIPRILVDKEYRQKIIQNIKDPVVRAFWVQEYESWRDQFRNEAIVPIQNKVGQFLSTAFIRNIVGQPKSSFNVFDIMNQRKILLVNVSKGRIGEDNAQLLGAMLITKIQLAAMERVRISETERKDFYLYVDEFQNFATESFASILSEARKYRLNLIIAHQYVGQLVTETTTKVRDAVFGNVGTMVVFRVGATDAEFLENEFIPEFEIQDLVNIPNHAIYIKLMVNGVTSRPFSALTLPANRLEGSSDQTAMIIEHTRRNYARSRVEVEADIERWSGFSNDSENGVHGQNRTAVRMGMRDDKAKKEERYTVDCSICGKPAHVNFKPDERRPVYCSDCLKKVQAGEIMPAEAKPIPVTEKKQVIEPTQEEKLVVVKPSLVEAPIVNEKLAPTIREGSVVQKPVGEKSLSLKDLPKAPVIQPPRRGPDIIGLKDALKIALAGKEKVLKPGESIKF